MLRRLSQLFYRYAAHHGSMKVPGFAVRDVNGNSIGALDRIEVIGGRLVVEGWCFSTSVGLVCAGHSDQQSPSLVRTDVTEAFGDANSFRTPGFSLNVRHEEGHKVFWVSYNGERYIFGLESFTRSDIQRMRRAQILPFTGALMRALPSVAYWYIKRDFAARARAKDILGLREVVTCAVVNSRLFASEQETALVAPANTEITIILPVYNAFNLLPDVLARVLAHTDLPYHLVIIEDKSSDDQVRPFLRAWHEELPKDLQARVEVLENIKNLGFIRSVNRAFERALTLGNHVVLLNSDAFVPKGWASRLLAPILEHEKVATVTPMSNDAEIFNVPVICQRTALAEGAADLIDNVAQGLSQQATLAEAPTGVGFCMAMNIEYLKLEPEFDAIFGRGYGEEVDWCRRVKARGGCHLGHAGLFVEHRGGMSFGSEEKLKLVLANNQIISKRYIGYDQMVQDFIRHDPLSSPRLALALAWANAQADREQTGPVPVFMAHDMGGGAEHYLEHRIASELESRAAVGVIRVGGTHRWKLEVHSSGGVVTGALDTTKSLYRMLDLLAARHVVYSCGVGDRDPASLPEVLLALAKGPANSLEILFHDFFPASPSYTLLDSDGVYRGMPAADTTDKAHQSHKPDGTLVSLREWRAAWGAAMAAADHVTVFSTSTSALVREAYPDSAAQIRVMPHALLHEVPQTPSGGGRDGVPVIGVLGNIGLQKGARILRTISHHLAKKGVAQLVVIGNIDPSYSLAPPARVHGSYSLRDVPGLVQKYGITDWLMPSIWPETFSYAVHEMIATDLPVWSFDLGAQGDAVRAAAQARGKGGVIALDFKAPDIACLLETMLSDTKEVIL